MCNSRQIQTCCCCCSCWCFLSIPSTSVFRLSEVAVLVQMLLCLHLLVVACNCTATKTNQKIIKKWNNWTNSHFILYSQAQMQRVSRRLHLSLADDCCSLCGSWCVHCLWLTWTLRRAKTTRRSKPRCESSQRRCIRSSVRSDASVCFVCSDAPAAFDLAVEEEALWKLHIVCFILWLIWNKRCVCVFCVVWCDGFGLEGVFLSLSGRVEYLLPFILQKGYICLFQCDICI